MLNHRVRWESQIPTDHRRSAGAANMPTAMNQTTGSQQDADFKASDVHNEHKYVVADKMVVQSDLQDVLLRERPSTRS